MRPTIEIALLPAGAVEDAGLMQRIAELTNDVYTVAEEGLWSDGATRTTAHQVAELTRAGEIAVARLRGRIVGSVRVRRLDERTGEFGMLVADPAHRGVGVGRELVRFAERQCRAQGLTTMQLELLVPRDWSHPAKEFLAAWYSRIGYRVARTGTIDEAYPDLAPLLATPCDFVIYRKDLSAVPPRPARPGAGQRIEIRRRLRDDDPEAIVAMHGHLYGRELGLDSSFEEMVAASVRLAVERGWPSTREGIWIVERDGELRGCVGLTDDGGGTAVLRWFLLDPSLRGKGLGRRLLGEVLDSAERNGYERVRLETFSLLRAAGHLYREQGFEVVRTEVGPRWGREEIAYQHYLLRLPRKRSGRAAPTAGATA